MQPCGTRSTPGVYLVDAMGRVMLTLLSSDCLARRDAQAQVLLSDDLGQSRPDRLVKRCLVANTLAQQSSSMILDISI